MNLEKNNSPEIENKISTLEQELSYLREQVAEKQSEQPEKPKEENTQEVLQSLQSQDKAGLDYEPSYHLPEEQKEKILLDLEPEEHDETINGLTEIIQKHGIINAVDIVSRMKGAHINDDFHRFLVQYIHEGYDPHTKVKREDLRPFKRVLLEVLIPKKSNSGNESNEHIYDMQSLLQNIQSFSQEMNEYITLEITKAVGVGDFAMYVSVHEDLLNIFEKQFLSLFPHGKLSPQKDDFNIFIPQGEHLISSAKLAEVPAKPIKQIDDFHSDPLDTILGVFTDMNKDEEGACLQFVIRPGKGFYYRNYAKGLEKLRKGDSSEEIYLRDNKADRFMHKTGKIIGGIGDAISGKTDDSDKKNDVDQVLVDGVSKKIEHAIYSTNIRLAVSSTNDQRTKNISNEIKSSFNQFSNHSGNEFKWQDHEKKDLNKMTKKFIYRQFDAGLDVPLNTLELSTVVHFPSEHEETASQMRRLNMTSAPIPNNILGNDGVLLGSNEHAGENHEVRMQPPDRLRHMYVIGQTGTGKTSLLKNMINQDIKNGEGVCFIDPHGSDIQEILAQVPEDRMDDVIYFDPSHTERPMGLNMLEYDERYPEQKTFVVNEMMSIFNKLFDMGNAGGPMFEQYFRNATMLVIDDPESGNTLLDVSRVLSDESFREMKLEKCKNPTVVQFWRNIATKAGGEASLQNVVPYITSKFDVFLSNDIMRPVIAQKESSFDFRKVMDEKKILLVNLSKGRLGDINSNLIGLIVVGKILMAALSRVDSLGQDPAPFYLYIDEFQNVTTDSISAILSEARKYKLSLCIAHQYIAQLQDDIRDSVFGNVGTMASFRVGSEDASFLENQFSPRFEQKDIMSVENYNFYLKMLNNGSPNDPFNVKLIPPVEVDFSKVDEIRQLSFLKYGRPREEVESKIAEDIAKSNG